MNTMTRTRTHFRRRSPERIAATVVLLALVVPMMPTAHADSVGMPRNVPPAYVSECAACHMAYPPGLLPAASWQRIMGGLDRHFGTDASMDPAAVAQVGNWLQTHAGSYKRVREAPPQDRITQSTWFARKHRDVAPEVWKRASVRSSANCMACHAGADKGDFDDDRVHIPK